MALIFSNSGPPEELLCTDNNKANMKPKLRDLYYPSKPESMVRNHIGRRTYETKDLYLYAQRSKPLNLDVAM